MRLRDCGILGIIALLIAFISFYQQIQKMLPERIDKNNKSSKAIAVDTNNLPTCNVKPGSVYDGDTLRVLCNNQEIKIRFACVDAPEVRPKQAGGIEARNHLRSLLNQSGNKVKINVTSSDRYGRTIAELYFLVGKDWQLIQQRQASDGMVWGYEEYKEDCSSWKAVASAERQAKAAKRGLWRNKTAIAPWEFRINR